MQLGGGGGVVLCLLWFFREFYQAREKTVSCYLGFGDLTFDQKVCETNWDLQFKYVGQITTKRLQHSLLWKQQIKVESPQVLFRSLHMHVRGSRSRSGETEMSHTHTQTSWTAWHMMLFSGQSETPTNNKQCWEMQNNGHYHKSISCCHSCGAYESLLKGQSLQAHQQLCGAVS